MYPAAERMPLARFLPLVLLALACMLALASGAMTCARRERFSGGCDEAQCKWCSDGYGRVHCARSCKGCSKDDFIDDLGDRAMGYSGPKPGATLTKPAKPAKSAQPAPKPADAKAPKPADAKVPAKADPALPGPKPLVTKTGTCAVWGPVFEATTAASKPARAAASKAGWVHRRGRYQYDENNGYCGETSLQVLMLEHGVWIPQEAARAAGGGELLPGLNYDKALNKLGVAYDEFKGRGYDEFMRWTKAQMETGRGVVTVAYFLGGDDSEYDHIMPIVAYKSCEDKGDSVYVHSNYDVLPVERRVADFSCTRTNKKDGIKAAGCVPKDTRWGYAIRGPTYLGIGPAVELFVAADREPGLGKSATLAGQVRVSGLQAGDRYVLHRLDGGAPKGPTDAIKASAWSHTFTAKAKDHAIDVSFKSSVPAHFICVAE